MRIKLMVLTTVGAIAIGTASASALGVPAPIRGVWNNIVNIPNTLSSGIAGGINQRLDRFLTGVLDRALGAMGLADPIAAGDAASQQAAQAGGVMSQTNASIASQQAQQAAAKAASQSILGAEGQTAGQQQLQQTTQSAASVQQSAQTGAEIPITQRKLDAILEQNTQMATIQSNIYSQSQQATNQLATANNTLAEINGHQTRQELKEAREAEAAANEILQLSILTGSQGGRYW